MKEIGPVLGDGTDESYANGIRVTNGSIYCLPYHAEHLLKIIPEEGQKAEVRVLKEQEIPSKDSEGEIVFLDVGALANDGCIYYLPFNRSPILKLDPNDGDRLSLVGEEIDGVFSAAVLGNDGYIYGISKIRI